MFDRQDCTDDPSNPAERGIDMATSTTKDGDKVGGSTITLLTFDTLNNKISVSTFDVYKGAWRTDGYEQYAFAMFSTGATSTTTVATGSTSTDACRVGRTCPP
jgi:hypothetical protein